MIGFAVTKNKAQKANDDVALAQESRGLPVFWLPGQYPIIAGMYSGLVFVPCDDQILETPLRGNPPLTPADFPEFAKIIDDLGGMSARITISPSDITPTE
jgi:hypothetical protein